MPTYKEHHMCNFPHTFTVFTPVFNCEKTINRVHESLLAQTYKNFEWLIINDGSTDNSHNVITQILKHSPLNIHYCNNEINRHKMSCFIQAISLAKGELMLPLDGDDECLPEALEILYNEYNSIPTELLSKVAAVTVNCNDQYGNLVGNLFAEDIFYCNTFEARITGKIFGEKWGFTRTDILKNIVINPEMFSYGGFIPESLIWNNIAKNGFLTKCVNKSLRIYHINREGSIMNTPMTSKSAFGVVLNIISQFNWFYKDYFKKSPIYFLKLVYIMLRSSCYLDFPKNIYLRSINSRLLRSSVVSLWPLRKLLK